MEPDPDARPPEDVLRDRIGRDYPVLRRMIAVHIHKSCNPKHVEMFIDETVQEAVCEALKSASRFDQSRPILPWLMGFAVNILKAKRRIVATEFKRFVNSGAIDDRVWEDLISLRSNDGDSNQNLEVIRSKVRDAIGRLDGNSQKAIYYRFFEGLEGQDLAQALKVSKTGTARIRTYRAVRKLKLLLISGARELVPTEDPEQEVP